MMNFEGWTITEATHGMDCHRCEWAADVAVSHATVTGSVGSTYTIEGATGAHSVTVTRDAENGTR